jgi:nucleolin
MPRFAFVTFESPEDAAKAITAFHEVEVDGRPCNASYALDSKPQNGAQGGFQQREDKPKSEPSATLFVGNLSFNSSEDSLRSVFAQYGDVMGVRVPTDRESGRMKGCVVVFTKELNSCLQLWLR